MLNESLIQSENRTLQTKSLSPCQAHLIVVKEKKKPGGSACGAGVGFSIPTVATHELEGLQSLQLE